MSGKTKFIYSFDFSFQIFYHVHKHLVDGLYPLADELNRLLLSSTPIFSPMDKLDALDSLNSILKSKVRIKLDEDEERDHLFIKVTK